jgi:hypothetical protein
VIREEGERTTFKRKTEMANSQVSGEEFTIKGGLPGFCG